MLTGIVTGPVRAAFRSTVRGSEWPSLTPFTFGLTFLLLLAFAPHARAADLLPDGPQFQVNSHTASIQAFPSVAFSDVGALVTWQSNTSPGTDSSVWSIQGQYFDDQGSPLLSQFQINTLTSGVQDKPGVATDSDGNSLVVWNTASPAGSDSSPQAISAIAFGPLSTTPLGAEFQVNTYTTSQQDPSAVAGNAAGDFVAVWKSSGSSGTDSLGTSIQAQRYESMGAAVGTEFQVNTYTTGTQEHMRAAVDASGNFTVVWSSAGSNGSDTSGNSIQAQRYDDTGASLGAEIQVNTYTSGAQEWPAIAFDNAGNSVVVWDSSGSADSDTSSKSIQAQRYDSSGAAVGTQFQVNTYTTNSQDTPRVTFDSSSQNFVVVWRSNGSPGTDSSSTSIQARLFSADAVAVGSEFQVNTFTSSYQQDPEIAAGLARDFMVAWRSDGSSGTDTSNASIQARMLTLAGCGDGVVDVGEQCDDGNADSGDCCDANCMFETSGSTCGDSSDTDCTNPDTCDGAGTCVANDELSGTACGDSSDTDCTNPDTCDGAGACAANDETSGTACGDSSDTECTNPDTCDGAGSCDDNHEASGTSCGDAGVECFVQDTCDAAGTCVDNGFEAGGTECRAAAGACDVAETCSGAAGTCPADALVAGGTECRASAGACDVAETCSGVAAECPVDGFVAAATECRAAAGVCDVAEACTGDAPSCPADDYATDTTECRAAAGACDIAEFCSGVAVDCPADQIVTAGSVSGGLNGDVLAMAVDGADVYVGGKFTDADGLTVNRVARWNDATGWTALGSGMNDDVRALAIYDGELYAGGNFTTAGGSAAAYLAKWDGVSWTQVSSGMSLWVAALAVADGELYVGGDFSTAGGTPAAYIAKWDGSAFSALGTGMGNAVLALAAIGTDVYAAGQFFTAGGASAARIAKWDGSSWSALGTGMNANVYSLLASGGDLYAGGVFTDAGGTGAAHVAKWNGGAWSALGSGLNNDVWGLGQLGGTIYAAGDFTGAIPYIAQWDGASWSGVGTGLGFQGRALATVGAELYVGGRFTTAGGSAADYAAIWTGSAWRTLRTSPCRAAASVCDVPEFCDGVAVTCPVDGVAGAGGECRAAASICDVAEVCDGISGVCPADAVAGAGAECRAAGGICDVAEVCDGVSGDCPADDFAPSSQECRAANGDCDIAETCTGSSTDCPVDGFTSGGTECRAAGGACDAAETCTGSSATCPADILTGAGVECRASAGDCDVAETCTGADPTCPADTLVAAGTECRAAAGACDVAETCSGASATCPADGLISSGTECRAVADECDVAEECSGSSAACPVDIGVIDGTSCDDSTPCTSSDTCQSGVCAGTPKDCSGSDTGCGVGVCETETGLCVAEALAAGTECRASGGLCDVTETCDGVSTACPSDALVPEGLTCRARVGSCDIAETCTGTDVSCPADEVSCDVHEVDTTVDAVDVSPGDGVCETASGNCSLRAAIQESNATSALTTIKVPAGTYLLTLTGASENNAATGDLDLRTRVEIIGAGVDQTVIDGQFADRIFENFSSATIWDLEIRNGSAGSGSGGGIYNAGWLALYRTRVKSSTARYGGGIYNRYLLYVSESTLEGSGAYYGGGIYSTYYASVADSTIVGNYATWRGGGIYAWYYGSIYSSTVSGNSSWYGGGLYARRNRNVRVIASTITSNSAAWGGGTFAHCDYYCTRPPLLQTTILAENSATRGGDDCTTYGDGSGGYETTITSANYNLIGSTTICPVILGPNDLADLDPMLEALDDNGGPTATHALAPGSPAIDVVPSSRCWRYDQRGLLRSEGGPLCDVGAYELIEAERAEADAAASSTVTTDGEGDGATAEDPIESSVTTPNAGAVSVSEVASADHGSRYGVLGQTVVISAPQATATEPLALVFRLDLSLLPSGADPLSVPITRNGRSVANCIGDSGKAIPDPCVASRRIDENGDLEIRVLTSTASDWAFGVDGCAARPVAECKKPLRVGKSQFAIKDDADDSKDQLKWKWKSGEDTTFAEFGDPKETHAYALCVYDESGTVPQLAFAVRMNAGGDCSGKPCWKSNPSKGFQYKNKALSPDGSLALKLKADEDGKAQASLKAKGTYLSGQAFELPETPLSETLRVQLQAENGACWSAAFGPAKKNAGGEYKAKEFGTACRVDDDCSDGDVCNGIEICDTESGACVSGTALTCDDGLSCTDDECDPDIGCLTEDLCSDGDECNGTETCDPGTDACVGEDSPDCATSDPCLVGECDTFDGCVTTPVPDGTSCGAGQTCVEGACE